MSAIQSAPACPAKLKSDGVQPELNVPYNYVHETASDLVDRVAAFVAKINRDACALADRLWVKDERDPEEEKSRFSA